MILQWDSPTALRRITQEIFGQADVEDVVDACTSWELKFEIHWADLSIDFVCGPSKQGWSFPLEAIENKGVVTHVAIIDMSNHGKDRTRITWGGGSLL